MKRKQLAFILVYTLFLVGGVFTSLAAKGQIPKNQSEETIPFGDMNHWLVREIKESFIIGGNTRRMYEIASTDTIRGEIPYRSSLASPWRTSNVLAIVNGITKCSVTVFPEKRNTGKCARLETRLEKVKVLGVINITVLASGTILSGEMLEPIRDTQNPQAKLNLGIPFTKRPIALVLDYKMKTNGEPDRIKATGFSRNTRIPGKDSAEVCVLLQKRWEDTAGNIYASRVGTGIQRFSQTTHDWITNHPVEIIYGDATKHPTYQPHMKLLPPEKALYCLNSKGQSVPIQETGWASPETIPTHVIVKISSSHGEAYVGAIGNTFWIDNLRWRY